LATQDREPAQPSNPAPAAPRTPPSQIAQKQVRNLKTGVAGRESVSQSPARKLNGE
jgi:hypothetical protein